MSSGRSWYLSPIAAIFTTTIISFFFFFFFNDTATTEIYTLSLHDALPISLLGRPIPTGLRGRAARPPRQRRGAVQVRGQDRKSTRLNSSHSQISYAVFCLKKKKYTPATLRCFHSPPLTTASLYSSYPQ